MSLKFSTKKLFELALVYYQAMIPYIGEYKRYKQLLDKTLMQINDEEFFQILAPSTNSVAIIMKHLAGNLASRFTDFLTTDGEKDWRDREGEFDVSGLNRADIEERFNKSWQILEKNVWQLNDKDMKRIITIRGVEMTVEEALTRSITHFSHHVGEILFIARYFRAEDWQYLSIAPGNTSEYLKNPNREKIS
ncbi:MAG TPA: DUF1572 domain-containing protein [Trueperaceae bacterium]|nr:DUF1572 domain-containing protein [Trueperaceae bacterium]